MFPYLSSPISSTYFLGNSALHQATTCRDLGIIFSEDLSWSEHYKQMLQSAYGHLRLLRRTFSVNSPVKVKRLLYLSLVRCHLTYGSQIWRPMYIKDIVILERIQKRATKYILNDRLSSYCSRLLALNLLPLMYYLELMDILFLVKCLQFPDPSFDIKAFVSFSNLSTCSGSACKLVYRYSFTNKSRHFYFNRVVRLWNSLPPIDISQSFSYIKSSLLNVF